MQCSASINRCRTYFKSVIGNAGQLIFREQSATYEQLQRGPYTLSQVNDLLNKSSPDASAHSGSAYAFKRVYLYQNKSADALIALQVRIHLVYLLISMP